ncbi:pyridoxamine 5'-phosphate oxidase family protein [Gaopeijia maritima]|uniref:pyridoxamine 5'-phosphate oxidase family protein n=1 Tax=Gaopeijia maritima TaxID=3119007 RepID=UPI003250E1A4
MTTATHTAKKIDELYELISDIEMALMTTRRPDGRLVSRPMASQKRDPVADLWFVTNVETHKIDELEHDPNVNFGYLDEGSMEWVSVSGTARISQDRELIRRLHEDSWTMWFNDEGGARDGGPDDPRLALILVEVHSAVYSKQKHSTPRTLFELAKGRITGEQPDVAREETLSEAELKG